MTSPPMARRILLPASLAIGLAVVSWAACREGPRSTVADLVSDAPIAEWWGPGPTRLVASPLTEINHRRGRAGGDGESEGSELDVQLFARWPGTSAREVALHLESGPSARAVSVTLNRGRPVRLPLRDGKRTYRALTGLTSLPLAISYRTVKNFSPT